jgi:hypothetical protein
MARTASTSWDACYVEASNTEELRSRLPTDTATQSVHPRTPFFRVSRDEDAEVPSRTRGLVLQETRSQYVHYSSLGPASIVFQTFRPCRCSTRRHRSSAHPSEQEALRTRPYPSVRGAKSPAQRCITLILPVYPYFCAVAEDFRSHRQGRQGAIFVQCGDRDPPVGQVLTGVSS